MSYCKCTVLMKIGALALVQTACFPLIFEITCNFLSKENQSTRAPRMCWRMDTASGMGCRGVGARGASAPPPPPPPTFYYLPTPHLSGVGSTAGQQRR